MESFLPTLSQMIVLFIFIIIGYVLCKFKVIPDSSASIISKLENTLFIPAVILNSFILNCTVELISEYYFIILLGTGVVLVSFGLGVLFANLLVKEDFKRKIYIYSLSIPNFSFVGIAVVSALKPDWLTHYLLFTIPANIMAYGIAIPKLLIPQSENLNNANLTKGQRLYEKVKPFLNPMFFAMLIGIILGVTGIGQKLPNFILNPINSLAGCMSPLVMLLTGMVIAKYNLKQYLKDYTIYIASALRLIILPLALGFIIKLIGITDIYLYCSVVFLAMPLGLSTVVVPTAYGKDTSVAAAMALVSHAFSVLTIPLVFAILL